MVDLEFVNGIRTVLAVPNKIVITAHTNPDGDAIGSSLALCLILEKLGHNVDVVVANSFPNFLNWMPSIDRILIHESQTAVVKQTFEQAEIIFCLDYNTIARSGSIKDLLFNSKAIFILIDHHQEPELQPFTYYFSDTSISSTSEMVYQLICSLGAKELIDKDIASCLFTGIMTDTGSFSHGIANASTFYAVADLIEAGLIAAEVHKKVYHSMTESRFRLMGFSINDRLQIIEKYNTAIIVLTKTDLLNFDYQIGDTEGFVNLPLSIDSIKLSILITEKKDHIHLSLRSKGTFSVNDMARKHFNGGGHINAAGGRIYASLQQSIDDIIAILPEFEAQLTNEI